MSLLDFLLKTNIAELFQHPRKETEKSNRGQEWHMRGRVSEWNEM